MALGFISVVNEVSTYANCGNTAYEKRPFSIHKEGV